MNIESLIEFAAGLMKAASEKHIGKLELCYDGQKLRCLPTDQVGREYCCLFLFRSEDFKKGLTAQNWNLIRNNIGTLVEELTLCLETMLNESNVTQNQSKI